MILHWIKRFFSFLWNVLKVVHSLVFGILSILIVVAIVAVVA